MTTRLKLVEVQWPDLVDRYLGKNAVQSKVSIKQANDGVLFVYKAHHLMVHSEKDYGKEALVTLMLAMLGGTQS